MFKNSSGQKIAVFAFDTTTSLPKTGDSANVTAYLSKDWGSVTQLTDTSATEMDATNAKGWYLFDVSQTETNADALLFTGKSSTANISVVGQLIYTQPANFSTLSVDSSGRVDVAKIAGTAQTARDIGASVLLSAGTGTGQLDFTSGVVKANLAQILGTALTETAGLLAGGFKKFFNVATPAATMDHGVLVDTVTTYTGNTPQTGDAFARLGAPAGASVSADVAAAKVDTAAIKTKTDFLPSATAGAAGGVFIAGTNAATVVTTSFTTTFTGNLSGSVGSVSGAVGSVAGDVGGNVTGSVGSVTGLTASNLDVAVSTRLASGSYTAPPSASTIAQAVWDALTSALTTIGSIGKLLVTDIDATISSRSSYAGGDTSGTTTLLSRLTSTRAGLLDHLDADISSRMATFSYTAPLDAAGTRTAVGLASANLDTQLAALPTADENADALLDRADAIETGLTPRQAMRLSAAADGGKLSGGATTTNTIRNAVADDKDRIVATVDASGNRTAITYDLT